MNWKLSPVKEYECQRRWDVSYEESAMYVLNYYGHPFDTEDILEFLKQVDPFGHKEYLTKLKTADAETT